MRMAISLIAVIILGCANTLFAQMTPMPRDGRPSSGNAENANRSTGARQAPPNVPVFSRQALFAIPFSVAQPNRDALEVHLFVSADAGRTWDLYAREPATKGQFGFHAGRDGEYCFASRIVPIGSGLPDKSQLAPELKVLVDTTEPKLDVTATVNRDGKIEVAWDATDDRLAADSLKVEYQSALDQPWQAATLDAPGSSQDGQSLRGKSTWAADSGGRFVSIRVQVSDMAGNVKQANRRLLVPTSIARNVSTSPRSHVAADVPQDPLGNHGLMQQHTAHLPAGPVEPGISGDQVASVEDDYDRLFGPAAAATGTDSYESGRNNRPDESQSGTHGSESYSSSGSSGDTYGTGNSSEDMYGEGGYNERSHSEDAYGEDTYGTGNFAADSSNSNDPEQYQAPADPEPVSWPSDTDRAGEYRRPSTEFASAPNDGQYGTLPYDAGGAGRSGSPDVESPTEDAVVGGNVPGQDSDSSALGLPEGERPRMTSSTRFNLAYSVDAAGPMGLEKVELWVTRNGGRDWNLWGLDEDMESPFLVEVEDEGTYGFRVVLVSKNGLASQSPRSGDLADLWVGIDTTEPVAEITNAAYGSGGHAGNLDIQWTAADDHFGKRPITFSFSEKRDGPWTTIASGLPNSGQYYWRVDASVPDKFYLRLEVRDEAGNLCIDQLKRPLQSAGLTPKGRVRSFEPVSE